MIGMPLEACQASGYGTFPCTSTVFDWRDGTLAPEAEWPGSWLKVASTLPEDRAPSASLHHLKAQAAPTHPRAQPQQLGGLPWPQQLT